MFVLIYTPGPAWPTVKTVAELPFYREHDQYIQQVFVTGRLLMGGAFLDNEGGLGILDVEDEAQARDIVAHDPFVQAGVVEAHLHPWNAPLNQYRARSAPLAS